MQRKKLPSNGGGFLVAVSGQRSMLSASLINLDSAMTLTEGRSMAIDFGECPECNAVTLAPVSQQILSRETPIRFAFQLRCRGCGHEWADVRSVDFETSTFLDVPPDPSGEPSAPK
jgi:hypothetical protein